MRINFILICLLIHLQLSSQNHIGIHFSVGHGNSNWQLGKTQIAETNQMGDTLHLYDVDTHGNAPTITGNFDLVYSINKVSIGLGLGIQHYFINELITESIYFEESNILAPTSFSSYNNPQPTHLKFSPLFGYRIISNEKFKISTIIKAGTYLTHSITDNSREGFHWFVNTSFEINYTFNEKLHFIFSPTFDYSRLNSKNNHAIYTIDKPFMNIYSFYNTFGLTYKLTSSK